MSDPMTPQQVAEYAVWYARKVKGPAAEVARRLLEEDPWLREPLEAAALSSPETTPAGVLALDEVAAWLLRVGYGIDYTFRDDDNKPDLAPLPILEAMVRLGGADPGIAGDDGEEGAYYVLSSELGDWRAAALGRSGSDR